ncbi:MAG: histidinol-phosphate transaminase [Gammaproteobacteria bacterium]|nr:MAG: histidinol-phosphate transaminase [Gammaproteobacteria bacterium]
MTSSKDRIYQLVRPEIRALQAYHVPDPGKLVKLDAMENPYTWPEWLRDAWLDELRTVSLNRYPDPQATLLKQQLRMHMGVPDSAGLILGNGSDELIQMIIQAVAAPGRIIMAPEPTFVMYRQIATVSGLEFTGVPLCDDFALHAEEMLAAIDAQQPAVVFLAYPNNPTGNLFDRDAVEAIIAKAPGLVVVDEAYAPFTDHSFLPAVPKAANLLVLRTLSKMGFAGLRLGLLAGPGEWLAEIEKTRLPYNISTLNQVTGTFALRNYEGFAGQIDNLRQERGELFASLEEMPEITVYPSEANFILFRSLPGRADAIFAGLKSRGVLIKNLNGSSPALADCLRVTVGQPAENAAFLAALKDSL